MGVTASMVKPTSSENHSLKIDDDETTIVGSYSDDSFDWEIKSDIEIKSSFSSTQSLPHYFDDLLTKSQYIFHSKIIANVFLRYMFSGCWVTELAHAFQSSSTTFSSSSIAEQNYIFKKMQSNSTFFENSFISSQLVHSPCQTPKRETNPPEFHFLMDMIPSITFQSTQSLSFLLKYSTSEMDITYLLTVALALQVFCRSELFLQLSEQQWSSDSIRCAEWQDYAREGRTHLTRQYVSESDSYFHDCCHDSYNYDRSFALSDSENTMKHEEVSCDCVASTVALLDALYVRLLLSSDQRRMRLFVTEHAEDWLYLLHQGLSALPLQMKLYETDNVMKKQTSQGGLSLGEQYAISHHDVFCNDSTMGDHTRTNIHSTFPKEEDMFLRCMQCFPSDMSQTIRARLFTCASATTLITPSPSSTSLSDKKFTCLQPMLRSPLVVFDHYANNGNDVHATKEGKEDETFCNMSVKEDYRWNLHRVVLCQSDVHNASVTMDMAFVLAQIFS